MSSDRDDADNSDDEAKEKTLVNFRLSVSQKERWENWIEDSRQFTTLTGLIRTSVEQHIKEDSAGGSSESPAIASDIKELQDDLERVRKDVRWLREQGQDDVDISDTAQEVFTELERVPDGGGTTAHRAAGKLGPDDGESEENSQTVEAIAEQIGLSEDVVEDAIEHLQDQFLPIVEIERGGQTHYFREE